MFYIDYMDIPTGEKCHREYETLAEANDALVTITNMECLKLISHGTVDHDDVNAAYREIRYGSVCGGGNVTCKAVAVWAFRIDERHAWTYACGRHLTHAMTYECEGERAAFDVRRIVTDE